MARAPKRATGVTERGTLVGRLSYRPEDYEEACWRERGWLALPLQMQQRRRVRHHGIEAQGAIVMLHDRVRYLRN